MNNTYVFYIKSAVFIYNNELDAYTFYIKFAAETLSTTILGYDLRREGFSALKSAAKRLNQLAIISNAPIQTEQAYLHILIDCIIKYKML